MRISLRVVPRLFEPALKERELGVLAVRGAGTLVSSYVTNEEYAGAATAWSGAISICKR